MCIDMHWCRMLPIHPDSGQFKHPVNTCHEHNYIYYRFRHGGQGNVGLGSHFWKCFKKTLTSSTKRIQRASFIFGSSQTASCLRCQNWRMASWTGLVPCIARLRLRKRWVNKELSLKLLQSVIFKRSWPQHQQPQVPGGHPGEDWWVSNIVDIVAEKFAAERIRFERCLPLCRLHHFDGWNPAQWTTWTPCLLGCWLHGTKPQCQSAVGPLLRRQFRFSRMKAWAHSWLYPSFLPRHWAEASTTFAHRFDCALLLLLAAVDRHVQVSQP